MLRSEITLHLFSISFTGLQYHVGFSAKSNLFVTAPFLTPRAVPMSLQSLDRLGRQGDMKDDSAETLFQSFLQQALASSCGTGRVWCSLYNVVHPTLPLPTPVSPTLQGAPRDGFGEAVMACDMPEPCKLPNLESYRKRFPWTHKQVDSLCSKSLALCSK